MKTLSELSIGQSATVVSVHAEAVLRRRLLDMGITPGCRIRLIKVAPLGDPLEIRLRSYELLIRKEEAALIEVSL